MNLMTLNAISATPLDCVKAQRRELAKYLESAKGNLQFAIEAERDCRKAVCEADTKLQELDAWLETANVEVRG